MRPEQAELILLRREGIQPKGGVGHLKKTAVYIAEVALYDSRLSRHTAEFG